MNADPLIVDTTARMLSERCGPEVVTAAEDGARPDALWEALDESALTRAWIPETLGGPGTSLADGFAIVRLAGTHTVPAPLAETLLAGWLASEAGLEAPEGPLTVAPVDAAAPLQLRGDVLAGSAKRVPFARVCEHIVAVYTSVRTNDSPNGGMEGGTDGAGNAHLGLALVPRRACTIEPGTSLAGEPCDTVVFDGAVPITRSTPVAVNLTERLQRMGAAMRSQQMAGALEGCLEQSLRYAADRRQFGRPIGKFQAVQHNLAVLAGEVAAATTSADAAASAIIRHGIDDDRTFLAVATAKIRCGQAAGAGAGIAHQIHGAMGFTREYSLQHRTRRLWAWRDEFGPETVWAIALGRHLARRGGDALWATVTAV
ncbi:MAG: acyl-CoA/acyl-ACP dehydrogenase [Thiotrichales bacterium]|nr:acyl-CoA/acyl-ACP dehydrogenase [Thiotrichales bacterium]